MKISEFSWDWRDSLVGEDLSLNYRIYVKRKSRNGNGGVFVILVLGR